MALKTFIRSAVRIKGRPFSFAGRPYLNAVYRSNARKCILRSSRQTEKSTLLCNRILYGAFAHPGRQILFVAPREEQARLFSQSRLGAAIAESPVLRKLLWGANRRLPTDRIQFDNGSTIFFRAAFQSADSSRGISADELFVDEFQDIAVSALPVLEETLSHAENPRIMLSGTPKLISNEIETYYAASTANEWQVTCPNCQHSTALNENTLAPSGLACPECLAPLVVNQGRWVSRNPQSMWGDGFSVNHLMVPWLNIQDILERQKTYDPVKFRNECLGLPVCLGDHIITRQEIEACCGDYRFATALNNVPRTGRSQLVAGIDWGGGSRSGTALVLGYMEPNLTFHIVRMDRWQPYADYEVVVREAAEICRRFQVVWIAADGGGNGQTYNRLLIDKLRCAGRSPNLYGILYSSVDQAPERDGVLMCWIVSRSKSIGSLFTRIKKQLIRFPAVTDSGSFLDEFVCELAEYDEVQRTVKYTKPENMRDDALHATNYAELLGLRLVHAAGSR